MSTALFRIIGSNPQQLTLPFALWRRPAIRELIRTRLGLEMQDRLIGKYLKPWGFTPQRPIRRALEQRLESALVARARVEGAVIDFGDETAVKENANWVRGYAPKGQPPVLAAPTRWDKLSMISASSPCGSLRAASTPSASSSFWPP